MHKSLFILTVLFMISCQPNNTDSNIASVQTDTAQNAIAEKPTENIPTGPVLTINGQVDGMTPGKKIFLDRKTNDATEVVNYVVLDEKGAFNLTAQVDEAGIYRLRLGIASIFFLADGEETINMKASLDGYNLTDYSMSGGKFQDEMNEFGQRPNANIVANYLKKYTTPKPLFHLFLVEQLDIMNHIELYKKVRDELTEFIPNNSYVRKFNARIVSAENNLKNRPVAIGQEAPEINLPNPDGKKIKLSSLKGKVVLLDFWASWCKPCRFQNPNLVRLYDKYKSKGFDVFSVSLDGLDDRRLSMFQGNKASIDNALNVQKQAWIKAIKDDKLAWPNHVSELKSWSGKLNSVYAINSIPRTFLIDKKGNVRFDNLHGQALEDNIKLLLSE